MESSKDSTNCFVTDSGRQVSQDNIGFADLACSLLTDRVQPSFQVQMSSKLGISPSFEDPLGMSSHPSSERSINDSMSYLANSEISMVQASTENGNGFMAESGNGLNDNCGEAMLSGNASDVVNCAGGSATCDSQEWTKTDAVSQLCGGTRDPLNDHSKSLVSDSMDFGESVALEDFGGDFFDTGCNVESMPRAADIFGDDAAVTDKSDAVRAEWNGGRESDSQGCPTIEGAEAQSSYEESEIYPTLDSEVAASRHESVVTNADNEKASKKSASKKVRRQLSEDDADENNRESPVELNINSRPRRSVARKSVFELLQVEYRGSGGSKKQHPATTAECDNDVNSSEVVRKKSPSKKKKKSNNEWEADKSKSGCEDDLEGGNFIEGDLPPAKIVSYTPDDFLADANGESTGPGDTNDSTGKNHKTPVSLPVRSTNKRKSAKLPVANSLPEVQPQLSFAAEFELASDDVLSKSSSGEYSKSELQLMAENNRLRARLKVLEESSSAVKKFKIDLQNRKFSLIRTPVSVGSGSDRNVHGKFDTTAASGPESGKTSEPTDADEAWKSRTALLDRREHKLRELSAELDERAAAVRVNEGALQRRERKLQELEKTLEYRERVLSRHEQSVQKRELEIELNRGKQIDAAADETSSGEHSTLIAEFQKRLDLRRQELDRRQNFLDTEREKLIARERELDRRQRELELKFEGLDRLKDNCSAEDSDDEPLVFQKSSAVKETNSSVKSKKRRQSDQNVSNVAKKAKVSTSRDNTPVPKKVRMQSTPTASSSRKGNKSGTNSAVKSKKLDYKLRKRSV